MKHPPQILPFGTIVHLLGKIPMAAWLVFAIALVAFTGYRLLRQIGTLATSGAAVTLGGSILLFLGLHNGLSSWQASIKHPKVYHDAFTVNSAANSSQFINPLTQGSLSSNGMNLDAMNPLAHQNTWLIAALLAVAMVWGVLFLIYKMMSPRTRAALLGRLTATNAPAKRKKQSNGEFPLTDVELGVRKDNGRPIIMSGQDRFLHTLVVGSTGTGKTSRILSKGVFQDIRNIADGVPMDVMVLDPDGGFAESALDFAEKLNVHRDVIDLRGAGGRASTLSFNPFSGGDITDIVDNVRAVLKEQMGEQDPFFQNAQDDLVRTVIQVQVPLWPETDFVQFADLVTDPLHFRAICSMVTDFATKKTRVVKRDKKDDSNDINAMWEHERPYVEARYSEMDTSLQSLTLSAARSFLMDTRTEAKLEHLEKVTKGLKIVVNELATNERIRQVLRRGSLPMLDFKTFFEAGHETQGRVIAIITGNRTFGKLFGKLFLVTLKMYALARSGTEWTRRPAYLWADEFSVFGTESFLEAFSQIRKYRVALTIAIQARSQLLDVSKKFLEVVEGNCRNKVLFPAPSANDAKFFEDSLGTVKTLKETHQENKLNWFWFDNRNLDRRVSMREETEARFSIEDISYGLSKDEAVFMMTVENQAQAPFIGFTSFANEWASKRRGFMKPPTPPAKPKASKQETEQPIQTFAWNKRVTRRAAVQTPIETPLSPVHIKGEVLREVNKEELAHEPEGKPELPLPRIVLTASESKTENITVKRRAAPALSLDALIPITANAVVDAQTETVVQLDSPEKVSMINVEQDESAASNESLKTIPQSNYAPKRLDLRRKPIVSEESNSSGKLCPSCETVHLELTDDENRWHCPRCGFERKKR